MGVVGNAGLRKRRGHPGSEGTEGAVLVYLDGPVKQGCKFDWNRQNTSKQQCVCTWDSYSD